MSWGLLLAAGVIAWMVLRRSDGESKGGVSGVPGGPLDAPAPAAAWTDIYEDRSAPRPVGGSPAIKAPPPAVTPSFTVDLSGKQDAEQRRRAASMLNSQEFETLPAAPTPLATPTVPKATAVVSRAIALHRASGSPSPSLPLTVEEERRRRRS